MWANKASDAVVARGGRGIVSRYGMLSIDGGPQPHTRHSATHVSQWDVFISGITINYLLWREEILRIHRIIVGDYYQIDGWTICK